MFEFDKIVRWQDVLDIVLVAILFYQLINIIRGTRSVQMVLGLIVLVGVYFLASILDLATLLWLLQTFLGSLFLIIIIVFQDDIRRALTQVGKSPFQRSVSIIEKDLDEITRAAYYLAKRRIGALIVIERETGLKNYVDSGFAVDGLVTKEMLVSIFMPVSPLHDGGVIISKGRINTAGAILPLTKSPYLDKSYGTRHRAAVGLSEQTDAVIVVVSEETQIVSVAQRGVLLNMGDEAMLTDKLSSVFISSEPVSRPRWLKWVSRT
jgi:diadenylate cyclase